MKRFLFVCLLFPTICFGAFMERAEPNRPVKYSVFKAHTILPETFRNVIEKNGKHLFAGLEKGLSTPHAQLSVERVMEEKRKITELVNNQAAFSQVAHQMGFVAGLVALLADPVQEQQGTVRQGFDFYLDYKLSRFHFVFDGYPGPDVNEQWLSAQLNAVVSHRTQYRNILEKGYRQVNGNPRFRFDERHPVYGVCSIYFSNVARLSAHLWYHAWAAANGDLTRTPLLKERIAEMKKKQG
ncbi:hypothetical protein SCOR_13815 [Sulfidibacter corallicola]